MQFAFHGENLVYMSQQPIADYVARSAVNSDR